MKLMNNTTTKILLGQYLTERLLSDDKKFQVCFVWNRSAITDESLDKKFIITDLNDFKKLFASSFLIYALVHFMIDNLIFLLLTSLFFSS